jgi:malate dehydrogenase (oxaloacetate-decarboxylating)
MDYGAESLRIHEKYKGKLAVKSRVSIQDKEDLSIAYTPGVAEPCKKIHEDVSLAYKYTIKGRTVAVVSDGTAVLGLGILVQKQQCLLWKVNPFYSKNSEELMLSLFV